MSLEDFFAGDKTRQKPAMVKLGRALEVDGKLSDANLTMVTVTIGIAEEVDRLLAAGEPVPASLWKELRTAAEQLAALAAEVAVDADPSEDVGLPKMGH